MILHVDSDVKTRKLEFLIDFRAWCCRICSWNLLLKLKFCLQRLQIRAQTIYWIENFFIDFDADSSVDNWKIARSTSNFTRMRAVWARIFAIDFSMISATFVDSVDEIDILFMHFNVILDVAIEKFEQFDETNCKDIIVFVIRFLDIAERIDDFCDENEHVTADFSATSLVELIVLFERNEQMFKVSWTEISWSSDSNVRDDDFDEIKEHSIDSFFFDSDTVPNVWTERWIISCKMIISKINVDSNICFDVAKEICNSDETNEFMTIDFFFVTHSDLAALTSRREFLTCFFECWSLLCLRNDFLKLKISSQCRHVDNFFVDFDAVSSAKDWKVERFNRMIASNAIADSNIDCWNFVNDSCEFCEASDFFSISHTKLTALIERCEFLTNFEISWLRICSYNSLLKLKFCLQNLQIALTTCWFDAFFVDFDIATSVQSWKFELLDETRREKIFAKENVFARTLLKRFNEINFDWNLNHSDARSHRHFDNRLSKFDLRYWCRRCSRCCRKFATSRYKSNSSLSDINVESKISIFWNIDVDFVVFMIFNSVRFATFRALRFALFWTIAFNSRCFCEENAFDKVISKRDKKLKCVCFLYHFQTESLRVQSMYSSNFVLRYRYNSWQCSRFRRKLVTSLNCLILESEHDRLELKRSIFWFELKKSKFENNENIEVIAKIREERWFAR